jgi:phenylacetate-coenzyme A ligase PaaK-like adenylate-forming protein
MDEVFQRYLVALGKTEWMPPEHLRGYQQGLIRQLVQHAYSQIPFYTKRLGCLLTSDGEIDLRRWNEVPVLTRDDATAYSEQMRARDLPATLGNIAEHKTSGSNGASLSFRVNALAKFAYNGAFTRLAHWHGADPSRKLAQIRIYRQDIVPQYPQGEAGKAWSWAAPDADVFGLDMRTPVDDQIEWLLRHPAPYLMTLPSNAQALAYAASPEVARALNFEIIFSISETVLPGTRELIADKLGAKLVGIYSCEEVGYVATECPVTAHYHICSEMTLVEIVDDAGLPVAPGQPGRVLVTGLYNYATPFIRYDIGDVAIVDPEPCRCGRSLPVLSQVLGRTRHAFVFRDGKRVWPRVWNATAIHAFVPCREFQVVQVDFEKIEVRYVADDRNSRIDVDGLRSYAREHLHPSVDIAAVLVEAIARGPGGKFDPFLSELS